MPRRDKTRQLTGRDARVDETTDADAGSGEQSEPEPGHPEDILPDAVVRNPDAVLSTERTASTRSHATPEWDLEDPRVQDAMTIDPVSIHPDATVEEAAGLLIDSGVRHLPVVDDDGRLAGIVSDRDLRERIGLEPREWFNGPEEALQAQVSTVMTPDPVFVRPRTTLTEALEILEGDRVGAIPVVGERDRVVGILSYVDALAWIRHVIDQRRARPEGEAAPKP